MPNRLRTRAADYLEPHRLLDDPVGELANCAGHPDHPQATAAAVSAADRDDLTVIAWAIPARVAKILNAEFGTAFVGRASDELDLAIAVDRAAQREAIRCHAIQSTDNPVLWRRLERLGNTEHLRYLRVAGQ